MAKECRGDFVERFPKPWGFPPTRSLSVDDIPWYKTKGAEHVHKHCPCVECITLRTVEADLDINEELIEAALR